MKYSNTLTQSQIVAILSNMRNLLATFELCYENVGTLAHVADAINHAIKQFSGCFVKVVKHWRDDTESWNTYALLQPSTATIDDDGVVLDLRHSVMYEYSADSMYVKSVDSWQKYHIEQGDAATIYIYHKLPKKEIKEFDMEFRSRIKRLKQDIARVEREYDNALTALGQPKLGKRLKKLNMH